jgi:hypothetical protein
VPRRRRGRQACALAIVFSAVLCSSWAQDTMEARLQPFKPSPVADARFWSLASGVYASGAADWYTTRDFRAQGVEEANALMEPVVDNGAALAAVKVGGGSLVNWASYALKRGKKRYWATPQIAWIVLNVAVSVHNYNQAREAED